MVSLSDRPRGFVPSLVAGVTFATSVSTALARQAFAGSFRRAASFFVLVGATSAVDIPAALAQPAKTPLLLDGTFEMTVWPQANPGEKTRSVCTLSGGAVECVGHKRWTSSNADISFTWRATGTFAGDQLTMQETTKAKAAYPDCRLEYEISVPSTINLSADGTLVEHDGTGTVHTSLGTGKCADSTGKSNAFKREQLAGTWRQLPSGTPAVTVAEAAPGVTPDASSKSSVRVDGNKVYVTDESGKESVVTLVPVSQEPPPTFSAPGAGELGTALQRFLAPQLWGAIPPSLPAGQRQDYVITVPQPGEGIVDAMTAAGESVVNWVTNNSAQRNLFVLGVGVSMALSHSTFAGAVDGASAPVGKQIIGGMLVMGVKGFVGSLGSTFLSNKGAIQRTHEAASAAGGEATASIPGNLLGGMAPGVMNFFRQGLSQTALTLASQGVNIATDAVVQKLGVSEKTADLLMKAPSFADGLMQPPSQPYEPGGIQFNFDR
jgi:hypothetical protein